MSNTLAYALLENFILRNLWVLFDKLVCFCVEKYLYPSLNPLIKPHFDSTTPHMQILD